MKKRTQEEIRAEIAQVESEMRTAIDSGRMRSVERLRGRKQALGHELERAMAQEAAMGGDHVDADARRSPQTRTGRPEDHVDGRRLDRPQAARTGSRGNA